MNLPIETGSLRRLAKEVRDVVEVAVELGYVVTWANHKRQVIDLQSQYNNRHLTLPSTNLNANRLKTLKAQIVRNADPLVLREHYDLEQLADKNRREGKVSATYSLATADDATELASRVRDSEERNVARRTALEVAMEEAHQRAEEAEREVERTEDVHTLRKYDDEQAPLLVSETPWMVRRGGQAGKAGRMYESHNVLHRVWSDGTEDYRCRYCEYTNENPRSVAGHSARSKVGHPNAEQAKQQVLTVPEYQPSEIKHPGSGIRRLTSELVHALDGIEDVAALSREELARTLAEHVFAARPDREPAAPLTPEQMIHRITLMVDAGRLAEMHQQVDTLASALREAKEMSEMLSTHATELENKVTALQDERRALRDMLAEG